MLLVPTLIDSVTVRKKKISDQEMQFYTTKFDMMAARNSHSQLCMRITTMESCTKAQKAIGPTT